MSIFSIISAAESGNRNVVNPTMTSSGNAGGYYQITTGTWHDFAPQAGVSLADYPTAQSAPYSVQTQVASAIPLSRWAPSTVNAVQAQYPGIDTRQTVGTLAAQTGSGSGFTMAADPPADSTAPPWGGGFSEANPGITTNNPLQNPALGSSQSTPAMGVDPGYPLSLGIQAGILSDINNWLSGVETSVGTAFKGAMSGVLGTLENWIGRGMLILIGVVIGALALWRLMDPGGEKTKALMQTAAVAA